MILTTEPGKGGKLYLFGDGEYIMALDPDIWYSLGYYENSEVTEEEFEELKLTIGSRLAFSQALRFLTLRSHSADELYKKLIKKHSNEASEAAVEKCRELGFIDDHDFAFRYANELANNKHYGPARIKNELFAKGVGSETIAVVMDELDIDFQENIKRVIEKKYTGNLTDEKGKKKTIAALMRLGYSYSDIRSAISELSDAGDDGYYEY